jgi:hypothetical protein
MTAESELKARAKLEWEAASERLGNLLVPPISGMPEATPKALQECFDLLQSRLDTLRAAYRVPVRPG